jgi:hypothetical protein
VRQLQSLVAEAKPTSAADARALLRQLARIIRRQGRRHAAVHDLLMLFSATQHFVTPTPYEGFQAKPWGVDAAAPRPGPKRDESLRWARACVAAGGGGIMLSQGQARRAAGSVCLRASGGRGRGVRRLVVRRGDEPLLLVLCGIWRAPF